MSRRYAWFPVLGLLCCWYAGGCMDPVVARAGSNRTVQGGDTVTLDGSKSSPADRNRIDFLWEVSDGPEVAFADPSAAITTFTAPRQASDDTVVVRLTVTYVDLSGRPYPPNRDTAWVRIRVQADPEADIPSE